MVEGEVRLYFSERLHLEKLFDKWCSENGTKNCAMNVVGFLQSNGLINAEKVRQFIMDNPVEL